MFKSTQVQPKVFCSYSWTNQDYQNRIIAIAERLMDAHIDVLLDKWDLLEGADTHAYMEKCVSDKSVTHVLIFCDATYTKKADSRSGGVGKETLIITPEIYGQEDVTSKEQRYIPIVMEKDDNGNAFLPVYIKGRYYIDMSSDENFTESFEQLVRAIYGKPLYKKPSLGKTPDYITADTKIITGLSTYKGSAISAVREQRAYALNRCRDYFEAFARQFESLRINDIDIDDSFDDVIINKINCMQNTKDECADVIACMIREYNSKECGEIIHDFFENIVDFTQWPEGLSQWHDAKSDHFKFILHELFLYSCAYAIKFNKENILYAVLSDYYCRMRFNKEITSYAYFRMNTPSLERRNKRLGLNRISLRADIIKERIGTRIDLTFNDIMQTDLFLFLHSRILSEGSHLWYPFTLVFAERQYAAFEIFARAQSKSKCDKLLEMLGCSNLEKFKGFFVDGDPIMKYSASGWSGEPNLKILCGIDKLGERN